MADWGWVTAGYTLVYGTVAGYAVWLAGRLRRTRPGTDGEGER